MAEFGEAVARRAPKDWRYPSVILTRALLAEGQAGALENRGGDGTKTTSRPAGYSQAGVYSGLPENRGHCVPVCRPDRNDSEVLLTWLLSARHRARVYEGGRINTPKVPASSILTAQPGHLRTALAIPSSVIPSRYCWSSK
jgi:hypothetical protein